MNRFLINYSIETIFIFCLHKLRVQLFSNLVYFLFIIFFPFKSSFTEIIQFTTIHFMMVLLLYVWNIICIAIAISSTQFNLVFFFFFILLLYRTTKVIFVVSMIEYRFQYKYTTLQSVSNKNVWYTYINT